MGFAERGEENSTFAYLLEEDRKKPALRGRTLATVIKTELLFVVLVITLYVIVFSCIRLVYRIANLPSIPHCYHS